jgi:hypothetical protein
MYMDTPWIGSRFRHVKSKLGKHGKWQEYIITIIIIIIIRRRRRRRRRRRKRDSVGVAINESPRRARCSQGPIDFYTWALTRGH